MVNIGENIARTFIRTFFLLLVVMLAVSCDGDDPPNGPDTGNHAPVLQTIGSKTTFDGVNLSFTVTATDADGTTPSLTSSTMPAGATFVDSGNGSGVFDWTPGSDQLGNHSVTFFATDDSLAVDSEVVSISVTSPGTRVVAPNGQYYKRDVGSSVFVPALQFAVADDQSTYYAGRWIHYTIIEGDGALAADSSLSDGSGIATAGYSFSGNSGHAVIRASVPGKDSVEVTLRHSRLVPGVQGQGQFLRVGDDYGLIQTFNGAPDELIVYQYSFLFIADYEQSLGVVFILDDIDEDEIAHDYEPILEIIVNDNEDANPLNNYLGKTSDSIGIGSIIGDAIAAYGPADSIVADAASQPFYWRYRWLSLGLVVYTSYVPDEANRDIREIHIREPS